MINNSTIYNDTTNSTTIGVLYYKARYHTTPTNLLVFYPNTQPQFFSI